MRRLNLPLVLDTVFAGLCAFLLFFTAIRFYTKNALIGLIFGICACLLFGALGYLYISKKQNKTLLVSRDEKNKKLLALHLSLSSDDYVKTLLKKCFGDEAKIRGNRIICGEQTCFFDFKMQPVSEDEIALIIKRKCDGKKVFYCNKISAEAAVLAENFLIEYHGINDVYKLLKDKDLLPEKYIYGDVAKISVWSKIKARFSRKLCAPLFWSGADRKSTRLNSSH